MNIQIYSRKEIEALLEGDFPKKTAAISFYDAPSITTGEKYPPVDYKGKADCVFFICIHDINIKDLAKYNLTFDTYFPEAEALAEYIYAAKDKGFDIICQCQYGQSRSAACAAAITEHFYKSGIRIFAQYQYYPNRMVFNKLLAALDKEREKRNAAMQ